MGNIKKALQIAWRNKWLWVLGFLSTLGSSTISNSNYSSSNQSYSNSQNIYGMYQNIIIWWSSIGTIGQILLILGIIFISLMFYLLFLYLSSRAQAGLYESVEKIENGGTITLGEAWKTGSRKSIELMKQNIIINIPGFLVSVVFALVFIILLSEGNSFRFSSFSTTFVPLVCCSSLLLIIYSIVASIIYTFSSRYAVLNNLGVIDSFKSSFALIQKNLGTIVVSWLAQLLVIIPYALVLFGIIFIMLIPVSMIFVTIAITNIVVYLAGILILGIFVWFVTAVLSSFLNTFISVYWTLVYKQLK